MTYAGNTANRTITLNGPGATDGFIGTASGIGGFRNINTVVGGNGTDTLNGLNSGQWSVVNANTVNYISANTLTIVGVETLVGGAGNDELLFANYFVANVTVVNASASDGFDLTELHSTARSGNINTLTGGAGADALNGLNAATTWNVNAISHSLSAISQSLTFSAIETVNGGARLTPFNINGTPIINPNGGAGDDVFNFAAGSTLTGAVDGQGGADTFNYASFSAAVTVSL